MGAQRATTRRLPEGMPDTGGLKLARLVGMTLDPWQNEILAESARRDSDGRWSAFEVCALVPRQNGKSHLIIARALAGALLYDEKLILYSAHEYRTAQEVWRTMRDICASDVMAPHVRQIRRVSGGESVEFHNGARFKLLARTNSSGRGFSPDCLLLDEAFALNDDVMASILPSMSARPNPQVCYFSMAGTWEAQVLMRLRRRGHTGAPRSFAYWEWHANPDDDPTDPRVWAKANPAYGRRLTHTSIRAELETMSRRAFLRERLGIWSESAVESVLTEEDVSSLLIEVPIPPRDGRRIGWGVDVASDRSGAAIAAAFYGDDGQPIVTTVDVAAGAGWVPPRIGALTQSYGNDCVAYDARGGLIDLMDRAARDYDTVNMPLKHGEYPAACAAFAQRVVERTIHIGRAPGLVSDATGATARSVTSGWVWDRKGPTAPTSLIAATCALRALEYGDDGSSVAIY